MSYILEALKKSEYVRQQGRVPDLATLPPVETPGSAALTPSRLPLLAGSALLLAIAVAGWWRPWQAPAAVATAPEPALPAASPGAPGAVSAIPAAAPVAAPFASPPTASVLSPSATIQAEQPTSAAPVAPGVETVAVQPPPAAPAAPAEQRQPTLPASKPLPPPVQSVQTPPAATATPPKAVLPALAPTPAAPVAAAPREAAPAPAAALPTPPNRVLAFYELPAAVRERIPRLAVSGFSYAEQPDLRMAVINDKVLRQGEDAAPGITLERIASDGVVLSFSGYRFRPQR